MNIRRVMEQLTYKMDQGKILRNRHQTKTTAYKSLKTQYDKLLEQVQSLQQQRSELEKYIKVKSAKITDFNLSKFTQHELRRSNWTHKTSIHTAVGTPHYMPPEQTTLVPYLVDRDPPFHSDVYSMGCVLYHLITGIPPYSDLHTKYDVENANQFVYKILMNKDERASHPRRFVSEKLDTSLLKICAKAMNRDQSRRYENVGEMLRDFGLWNAYKKKSALGRFFYWLNHFGRVIPGKNYSGRVFR
jgi:serine/threonine protein kinase